MGGVARFNFKRAGVESVFWLKYQLHRQEGLCLDPCTPCVNIKIKMGHRDIELNPGTLRCMHEHTHRHTSTYKTHMHSLITHAHRHTYQTQRHTHSHTYMHTHKLNCKVTDT